MASVAPTRRSRRHLCVGTVVRERKGRAVGLVVARAPEEVGVMAVGSEMGRLIGDAVRARGELGFDEAPWFEAHLHTPEGRAEELRWHRIYRGAQLSRAGGEETPNAAAHGRVVHAILALQVLAEDGAR